MTIQVTAADLRAVAADMREKANAATPGPWEADGQRIAWVFRNLSNTVARTPGPNEPLPTASASLANAQHMAAWHPGVALAVADWLDKCADRYDLTSAARLEHDPAERDWYDPAAAVARAWRGDQA